MWKSAEYVIKMRGSVYTVRLLKLKPSFFLIIAAKVSAKLYGATLVDLSR